MEDQNARSLVVKTFPGLYASVQLTNVSVTDLDWPLVSFIMFKIWQPGIGLHIKTLKKMILM